GFLDGEPHVMTPEIICVMDSETGDAIGTEMLRYGQRVVVTALPCAPLLRTSKGLQHVGPRAFGYDVEFRSIFDRQTAHPRDRNEFDSSGGPA
ncbi:MAG: DUF917 family protein, partial [Acidobacteria bacterium]|nr:DUF917 family protein [Acidobacteriota bacterium]